MPLGKVIFNHVLFEGLSNETKLLINDFMKLGKVKSLVREREEYVYTVDHPHFVEPKGEDLPSYILHFNRKYDPLTNSERPYIAKLTSCAEGIKYRVVRVYA